jgi:hypothetical protein
MQIVEWHGARGVNQCLAGFFRPKTALAAAILPAA